jgi:hypothetical protein
MLKGFRFGFSAFTGTKNFRISISGQKTGNFPLADLQLGGFRPLHKTAETLAG